MELTDGFKSNIVETGKTLRGVQRRLFMARTVRSLGSGGQRRAEREFGWNRVTIRKGMHELRTGITCCDAFTARGRWRHSGHRQGIQSNGPAVSDAAVVHPTDRGRASPTTDRPQGIRGGGTADSANVANEAQ